MSNQTTLTVIPADSYALLGTGITLQKGIPHKAVHATNQPDWEARKSIFVTPVGGNDEDGVLLHDGEYAIVEKDALSETMAKIVQTLRDRLAAQGIKPTSNKGLTMQAEFLCGAMAAMDARPPGWVISIMTGRSVV